VSEIEDWILPDLDRCIMEMEQRMLQVLELLKASPEEADAETKARHERFFAILDGLKSYGKETTTCQTETTSCPEEMRYATRLEATLEEIQAAVECQELQMEEAVVDAVGLAARRRRGAKKRTQDSVGSRQKLSAARKRVICCAVPAVRKGQMRKSPGKGNVDSGVSRAEMLVKSRRPCHKGRRHRDTKNPSYPRTRKTTDRILMKTLDQEVAKRAHLSTNELQNVIYRTF
jgi:hypothetical protein